MMPSNATSTSKGKTAIVSWTFGRNRLGVLIVIHRPPTRTPNLCLLLTAARIPTAVGHHHHTHFLQHEHLPVAAPARRRRNPPQRLSAR